MADPSAPRDGEPGGHRGALGREEHELDLPDSIKLGLGDFIFYSMLVGRAAMYDYMTGASRGLGRPERGASGGAGLCLRRRRQRWRLAAVLSGRALHAMHRCRVEACGEKPPTIPFPVPFPTAVFAAYLAIIAGLGLTLLCLAVFQKALPALPFSIALGVLFYFVTRLALEPFLVPLATNLTYY